ncbi:MULTISPECIES: LPS export ABC transporter periplasmic protein LptC [unclassified Caulobacter]|uniref:LPS export ABC transporter periplasmic protein LptC n=1 Tax=unclassified Caulobacter TaxID=2648921 RepID=UPI000D3D7810|nr:MULTISPECIES: LPS export ABC transporter periplasmic protein LptC [unclassified Caulobacter]PTS88449.1 hypothetical protein DBR21_09430 [Caulobacter sp. HMWF009]PTT11279.1 hypothetical protein DBR10_03545 [Caulobacter sp. HMWF025]
MTTTALPVAVRRKTRPRRRKAVRILRLALPALAASVLVAIIAQTALGAFNTEAVETPLDRNGLRMDNPRFTGLMKDGRTFLITATGAVRDTVDPNRVALDAPHLTRGYGSPEPTQVVSRQGVYDEAKGLLQLTGDVRVNSGNGYDFSTQQALIDTRTGDVVGQEGINGASASGNKVQADSYAVSDKGDRVVFKGRVKTRLNPGQ